MGDSIESEREPVYNEYKRKHANRATNVPKSEMIVDVETVKTHY